MRDFNGGRGMVGRGNGDILVKYMFVSKEEREGREMILIKIMFGSQENESLFKTNLPFYP